MSHCPLYSIYPNLNTLYFLWKSFLLLIFSILLKSSSKKSLEPDGKSLLLATHSLKADSGQLVTSSFYTFSGQSIYQVIMFRLFWMHPTLLLTEFCSKADKFLTGALDITQLVFFTIFFFYPGKMPFLTFCSYDTFWLCFDVTTTKSGE